MGCSESSSAKKEEGAKKAAGDPDKSTNKNDGKKEAKEENKDFTEKMEFLKVVPLFKRLPPDQMPLLATSISPVEYKKDAEIIKQGDPGDTFYIIKSGEARVMKQEDGQEPTQLAVLKSKDYFGENALIREEPRAASIIANTAMVCFSINRTRFQELGLQKKLQFANRNAVGAGGGRREIEIKPPTDKTPADKELIKDALKKNEYLVNMVQLDEKKTDEFISKAWKETVKAGVDIITEGDLIADYFYICQKGSFAAYVTEQTGEPVKVAEYGPIGSFGELALLYLVPRAATVKAITDSVVWVIDRKSFKEILMEVSYEKVKEYCKYLNRVEILNCLLDEEKKALARSLVEMHFKKNEAILKQGDSGNTFYIMYEGKVQIIVDEKVADTFTAEKGIAKYFGEKALLKGDGKGEKRTATVQVVSETAKVLALERDAFETLLGPLQELIDAKNQKKGAGGSGVVAGEGRERIRRNDLAKIGLLGCGGFGAVELYEHKTTKNTYAMKGLSKGYIVKTGMQDSVMNEKNILLMTKSPFIIQLYECYNGSQTLYFLMEAALGGELYATYNRKGFHGSEKHAKFYCAGVVFAFQHMHERRIIYRDLKPENLLLNKDGQIKLTDMGLAKFVIGKTYTTCGTPDYFAPELIASTGHTNAVDWWTLGILTFELMSGHPPFESAYPMQIYSKVMKGITKVPFPPKCQGLAGDLIKALLKKEPSERLPMQAEGIQKLKDHKWYKNPSFSWEKMKDLTMEVPYKPVVKSMKDIANFSARKEDMPRQLEYKDDGSGWDKDFATDSKDK